MASIAEGNTGDNIDTEKATKGFMGFVKGAQDKMTQGVARAEQERGRLQEELTQDLENQQKTATSGWGKVQERLGDIARQGKEARDNAKANLDETIAKNQGRTLHDALIEGQTGIKEGVNDGMEKARQGYKSAGQAKDVATQEAARVHAETVSNTPSVGEERTEEGEGGEQKRMEGGRRRRRKKSRKKKKKSKRTKRMSKKSRSSRKRRTRRRKRGGEDTPAKKKFKMPKFKMPKVPSWFGRKRVLTTKDEKPDILKSTEISGEVGKLGAYQGQTTVDPNTGKTKAFIGGKRRKSRRKKRRKSKKRKSRRSKKSRRRRRR